MELLPDIPRWHTALAEWLSCLVPILIIGRRRRRDPVMYICFLTVQILFLIVTDELEGALWILCMAAAFALMICFIKIGGRLDVMPAAGEAVFAFTAAELAASLEWQLVCFFHWSRGKQYMWCRTAMMLGVYVVLFGGLYMIEKEKKRRLETAGAAGILRTEQPFALFVYLLMGVGIFTVSNAGFMRIRFPFGGTRPSEIFNSRTLIDMGGVFLLYMYRMQRNADRVATELASIHTILKQQYFQYEQSREAMELIHYKYHDLKHFIQGLGAMRSDEQMQNELRMLDEELSAMEMKNKTGHSVIDTLLGAKYIVCKKRKITLTYVIDGARFSMMSAMDICTIFGNALDNAVESTSVVSDEEKRLIHVSACVKNRFLILRFANYFGGGDNSAVMIGQTTKKDKRFHGYGLKSMRYTVEKYGGEMTYTVKEGWFTLTFLIPVTGKEQRS